ncbi:hypothetical protein ACSNOI_43300 [Actinomadura kijaniata]|uniref:hypothetical protein n=1 Tax=Actinomadura kijaniata TaxID=46161 RepID=UPI003F194932
MSDPQGPGNGSRPEAGDRVETPGRPEIGGRPPAKSPENPQQTGKRALWLGIGSLALMLLPTAFPLALGLAVAALIVGIRARRSARRLAALTPGGATAGITLGAVTLALATPLLLFSLLTWSENARYTQCRDRANTISDEQACWDRFRSDLERRFNLPKGSVPDVGRPS